MAGKQIGQKSLLSLAEFIRTAREHDLPVDVIKQVIKHPHILGILAYELAIWWCVMRWLDETNIRSDDLSVCQHSWRRNGDAYSISTT